jgi:hydrogenase small subunit
MRHVGDSNEVNEVHVLWVCGSNACHCITESFGAAAHPSLADLALGLVPGIPKMHLHKRALSHETGEDPSNVVRRAANGEFAPFVLVVEGLVRGERWVDELAPKAWAVIAIGSCAAEGGARCAAGRAIGAFGLSDYLGSSFRSAAGIPIVNVPGCPASPDYFFETLLWLVKQVVGKAPMIPLDSKRRPTGLSRAPFIGRARRAPSAPRLVGRYGRMFKKLRSITHRSSNREARRQRGEASRGSGIVYEWPVERKAT